MTDRPIPEGEYILKGYEYEVLERQAIIMEADDDKPKEERINWKHALNRAKKEVTARRINDFNKFVDDNMGSPYTVPKEK